MALTKAEQKWIEENMKEDFEVGFSEKLTFDDGVLRNIAGHIPEDEAESNGYFCMNCGKTKIPDVEEHAKMCMYFTHYKEECDFSILFTQRGTQWVVGPYQSIEEVVNVAKETHAENACIIKLLGYVKTHEKPL